MQSAYAAGRIWSQNLKGFLRITCIGVRVGARYMKHAGTVGSGETVGGSSSSSQLSPGRRSTGMINDGCSDAYCKVLVKCVGENLLATA